MMNARERLESALHHREPDRTPVFEYVLLSPLADVFLGRPYAGDPANWAAAVAELGWDGAVRRNAADRVELAARLGHDLIYAVPVPPPPAPAGPPAAPAPAEPQSDDPVARLQARNRRAQPVQPPAPGSLLVYVYLKEEMARRGLDLPILAPAYAHGVWTDVDLMQAMVLEPAVAHEHFALATQRSRRWIEAYLGLGLELIGVGGDFAGTRPLISPAAYREFIVPEVRQLSRHLHAAGAYAVNASDGDLWSVLGDFLWGCEVDAYLEIDMHAGMDLRRLKAACGDQITLFGNLDCGNILSFGTPEVVRQHTLDCIEAGLGHGGHVLCASNAITASVPLANYLAVVNAYRDRFDLPRVVAP